MSTPIDGGASGSSSGAASDALPRSGRGRRLESLAHRAADWAEPPLLVGLDVIGDCLTEINVTSPTGFQEITQQTGFDVAAMFVDALERALA